MKVSGLFAVFATALAAGAVAVPDSTLDERATVKFNAAEAAALKAQTQSTISQLRNLQRSYDSRVRSTVDGWSGSARAAIQQDVQSFDTAIAKANQELEQIVATLNRLL
ncbi:Type VII secretion system ESAT-6-like protein, partial [Metarhizium majus ARSEF 297]